MSQERPQDEVMVIPALDWRRLRVRVVGLKPYVSNAWRRDTVEVIKARQAHTISRWSKRAPRDPEQEFVDSMHFLPNGRPGIPVAAFWIACVSVVPRVQLKPRLRRVVLEEGLRIEGRLVPIDGPPPAMREDMVPLPNGVHSPVYRAEFWPWAVDLSFQFDADLLSPLQIITVLRAAGIRHGIGSGRPRSKHGRCYLGLGTFEVLPNITIEPLSRGEESYGDPLR